MRAKPDAQTSVAAMQTLVRSLRRCRPLDDPVRHWLSVIRWSYILSPLAVLGVFLIAPLFHKGTDLFFISPVLLLVAPIMSFVGWRATSPFFRSRNYLKVLYLRAFAQDTATANLRKLIRASLPPGFSLDGIRQPRKRIPWVTRFFGEGLAASIYIGTEYFELEAGDHNWLARLLATSQDAHGFVIDLSTVTTDVRDEIILALLVGGAERCLFLIPETQNPDTLGQTIADLTGVSIEPPSAIRFQIVPSDLRTNPIEFVQSCRQRLLAILKTRPMGANLDAFEFVRKRVKKRWATEWTESLAVTTWIGVVLLVAATFSWPVPMAIVGIFLALASVVLTSVGRMRLRNSDKFDRAFGRYRKFRT